MKHNITNVPYSGFPYHKWGELEHIIGFYIGFVVMFLGIVMLCYVVLKVMLYLIQSKKGG